MSNTDVEALLRRGLEIDAQVDCDSDRPQYPITIGTGEDTELVPVDDIENRLMTLHVQETILNEAEACANDMIDRSQSENTKSLYAGSCNRFFDWAKDHYRI